MFISKLPNCNYSILCQAQRIDKWRSHAGPFGAYKVKPAYNRYYQPARGYPGQFKYISAQQIPTVYNGRYQYGTPNARQYFLTTGRRLELDNGQRVYKAEHLDHPGIKN